MGFLKLWGGVALVFIVLSAFVVYGLSRRITRPINRLTEHAENMAQGYLEQVIPVESQDEIGRLAATFNNMARSLKGNMDEKERLLTNLQNLNRTLRESELRFRSVAQSANDAIISADSSGKIISWNTGAQTIFGFVEEEVLGKPLTMLMSEEYREQHQRGLDRLRSTGEARAIGKTLEVHGLRKDGSEFPLELSLATWQTEEGTFYSGIIRDITERKRAEEAQKRLVAILEATPDFVGIADKDGRALYVNRAGRTMIGIEENDDISHTTIADYHPEWASAPILNEGIPLATRDGVWAGETALLRRDGQEIPISQIILAHKNAHGSVEFFSTVARDITERKRAEESLQALTVSLEEKVKERTAELEIARDHALTATRHKSEFLANMSHELRTPLNAVIGFSEVLLEKMFGDINAKQEEYLQDIASSGRHLLALINDILDLSKVEAGRVELELTTFDLAATLENTLTLVRERAMRHGIAVVSEVPRELGDCTADELKVKQVLLNLLSNAIKFTPDGGGISLKARVNGHFAEISVTDTGVGVAPDDQSKIFEEFYRAKAEVAKKREGTGLGLALTKKFVELHGGTIWLESQLDHGSTFTFTLPMQESVEIAPAPAAVTPKVHDEQALALVVEDDPRAAKLLSIYLKEAGFVIEVANSGEAGLEKARALHPAVIALDILMQGIDGWEFLARLKADRSTAGIPVVVVSMVDERGKGFALGAAEYLVKPVDREAVISAVRRVVRTRTPDQHEITILAVDDDPIALDLIQAVLQPEGWTVIKAAGGRLGVRLARERRPCLIVLDLLMPDVDGFQVLEDLKRDPLTASIPVVVLNCQALTPEEKAALNGRITDLIQKGQFSHKDFVAQIRSLVNLGSPELAGRGDVHNGSTDENPSRR